MARGDVTVFEESKAFMIDVGGAWARVLRCDDCI